MSKEIENDVIFNKLKDLLINYYDVTPKLIKINSSISLDFCLDEDIDNLINDLEVLFKVDFSDFDKFKYNIAIPLEFFPLRSFFSRYKENRILNKFDKEELLVSDIIRSIKAKKWIYLNR